MRDEKSGKVGRTFRIFTFESKKVEFIHKGQLISHLNWLGLV